jgi:hypothetical protein
MAPGSAWDRITSGRLFQRLQHRHGPVPVTPDGGHERFRVKALDRALACLIDRRDQNLVGLVETAGEFLKQVSQARVAVRLAHGDDLPLSLHGPGGLQHGGDFHRVMAVIVNDPNRRLRPPPGSIPQQR